MSTNIRCLNSGPILKYKMKDLLSNLDSDIKIVIHSHTDENTINLFRKDYKLQISQYDIEGNFAKYLRFK